MTKGHMIKRFLTVATAVTAAAFPATAQAWIVKPNPDEQVAVVRSGATANPVVRPNPDEQVLPRAKAATVRATSVDGDFDWGDAGIGAAASTALLGAGLLAVGMTRRRRTRRSALS